MSDTEDLPEYDAAVPVTEIDTTAPDNVSGEITQPDTVVVSNIPDENQTPETPEEKLTLDLPHQNFKITWNARFQPKKESKIPRNILNELPILPVGIDEYLARLKEFPNESYFKGLSAEEWVTYIEEATNYYMAGNVHKETLSREGSEWGQSVESDVGPLCLTKPTFGNGGGTVLKGERAQMAVSAIMNIGSLMCVPLWETGIWVKIKPPPDGALLALETRISEEKTMLGRQTNGMVFSNSAAFIHNYLLDLIFSCIYDCSYGKIQSDDLKARIKTTDIPTLVWGFLCTIYPSGYPLAQPCINNPESCQNIVHEMIMISKLMWVDKAALTPNQIKHMTQRDKHMTDGDIERYQQEHKYSGDKLYTINETMQILLRVPTIREYIDSGYKWVDGIERMVAESFAVTKQGEERNRYITQMSATMVLRQYSHWVKEIYLFDDPTDPDNKKTINDIDTIEETMVTLSKDSELVDEIIKCIAEFIDRSTISVIGIPRYGCPICNEDQGKFLKPDQYIIPLDIMKIFFTLQNQRLWKATYSTIE